MNIVQVNLYEDPVKKRYTYKVPDGIALKAGYIVKVKNKDGREIPAVCVSDSENLSDNAVSMVMQGLRPTCSVIGYYSYMDFSLVNALADRANA